MSLIQRCLMGGALALGVAALPAAGMAASGYPSGPVRILVQNPPGGTTDLLARLFAAEFSKAFGQPFIVENRPGAGGNIATEYVARAAPDGYTLLLSSDGPITINPSLYKLNYDPVRDLAPIILAADSTFVMLAAPDFEANSVTELIELAKRRPGELQYASSGLGTQHHLAGELFKTLAELDIAHIPYKGFGPASIDVMAGRVDFMFGATPVALSLIEGGRMKALAVTGRERIDDLPETSTLIEAGLPGFEIYAWFGLMAPAGTPGEVIEKLYVEADRILASPEIADTLSKLGVDVPAEGPEPFAARIQENASNWAEIIRISNASLEQ